MLKNYLRLMRPADWVKNVFILPAIIFTVPALMANDQMDLLPQMLVATLLSIVAFGLLSSAVYCINDSLDYQRDRLHPVKQRRPIAAGVISPSAGAVFGVVLAVIGILVGFMVNTAVGACLGMYVILQVLYNAGFKKLVVVDAVILAIGFSIRAAAGAFAISTSVSMWLLGLVFFLTLYLAFIKRRCDLATVGAANADWSPPAGYDDMLELNWLLSLSGVSVVIAWVLYTLSAHAHSIFGIRAAGFAILTPLVFIVVHRFYRRSQQGRSESPLAAFIEDRTIAVSLVLFAAGVVSCLYVPWVEIGLDRLIFVDGPPQTP